MLKKATGFGGTDYDHKGAGIDLSNLDKSRPVFGIDLGTTNSAISVIAKGSEPKTIMLTNGKMTMPSCVMLENGEFIVGQEAYENRGNENVIYSVKRMMQTPGAKVTLIDNGEEYVYTPAEISAEILKGLVEQTGGMYGDIVDVIVTVPAYFDQNGVNATKEACELAGLNLLGIANEPTAASLCYHLEPEDNGSKDVIVYDLGGGTFDVTLMRIQQGGANNDFDDVYGDGGSEDDAVQGSAVVTLGISGDTCLGGDDIDSALLRILYKRMKADGIDVTKIPKQYKEKLLLRLEKYKKESTIDSMYEITINCTGTDGKPIKYEMQVSNSDFKKAAEIIFEKTKKVMDGLLRSVENKARTIVLTGGSTKSIWIQSCLKEAYPGFQIDCALSPDLSVSQGAAIQGSVTKFGNENVQIFDILPLTIGVRVADNKVEPLIKNGTPLPVTKSMMFTTERDNQEEVAVRLVQGNSVDADECVSLGVLRISGIEKKKAGEADLLVIVSITANRLMKCVSRIDGIEKSIELDLSGECAAPSVSTNDDKTIKRLRRAGALMTAENKKVLEDMLQQLAENKCCVDDVKDFIREHREDGIRNDCK